MFNLAHSVASGVAEYDSDGENSLEENAQHVEN